MDRVDEPFAQAIYNISTSVLPSHPLLPPFLIFTLTRPKSTMERVGKAGSNTVASRHRNTLSCNSAASLMSLWPLLVDRARGECRGDQEVEDKKDGSREDDDDGPTGEMRRGRTLALVHQEERQHCRTRWSMMATLFVVVREWAGNT